MALLNPTERPGAVESRQHTFERWIISMKTLLLPLLCSVAFVLAAFCWGLASPVGSSPDETFNLPMIWCAWGEHEGCRAGVPPTVDVHGISHLCTLQKASLSASCVNRYADNLAGAPHLQELRQQQTLAGMTLYHRAMRIFVGPDATRSVLMMRLANCLLAGVLLFMALTVGRVVLKRAVALAWMTSLVPLGFFIVGSVNPSSWAFSCIATFWAFLFVLLTEQKFRSPRFVGAAAGAAVTALLAIAARTDSVLYLCVSALAVACLTWRQLWANRLLRWIFLGATAVGLIAVASLTNVRARLGDLLGVNAGGNTPEPTLVAHGVDPLANHLLEWPSFLASTLGMQNGEFVWPTAFTRGLGWLDSQPPTLVGVLVVFCFGGVVIWGLGWMTAGKLGALLLPLAGLLLMSIGSLYAVNFASTFTVQSRYLLPLVAVLVGIAAYAPQATEMRFGRGRALLVATLLSVANAVALLSFIRRNTNGTSVPYFRTDLIPSWWWDNSPVSPDGVWILGAIAGTVFFSLVGSVVTRAEKCSKSLPTPRDTSAEPDQTL
jgi:hypothetical protein